MRITPVEAMPVSAFLSLSAIDHPAVAAGGAFLFSLFAVGRFAVVPTKNFETFEKSGAAALTLACSSVYFGTILPMKLEWKVNMAQLSVASIFGAGVGLALCCCARPLNRLAIDLFYSRYQK